MTISEEQYQKLVGKLKDGTLPDDLLDEADRAIQEYKTQPAHPSASHAEEGGSMIGSLYGGTKKQGLEAVDESIAPPEDSPSDRRYSSASKFKPTYGTQDKAFNASGPAYPDRPEVDPNATGNEAMGQQSAFEKWYETLHDRTKTDSASQMRDTYRPSVLTAPAKPMQMNPGPDMGMDALQKASNLIDQARRNMPTFFQGGAEHYNEPTIQEFQRDMFPVLGDDVFKMTTDSDQYKQYSDKQWANIFDKAKAAGEPVVRHKYATGWEKTKGDILSQADALAFGADKTVSFGLGSKLTAEPQDVRNAVESHPVTAGIGQVGGALLPNAPGALTGLLGKAAGAGGIGASLGSSVPGRLAQAGAGAGTFASIDTAGNNLTSGRPVGENVGTSMALGGAGGTALKVLGEAGHALLPEGFDLAKAVGARSGILSGIKPGPRLGELGSEAADKGVKPFDLAIEKAQGPLQETATKIQAQGKAQQASDLAEHFKATEDVRVAAKDLMDKADEIHQRWVGKEGEPLGIQGEAGKLREIKNKFATVTPADELPRYHFVESVPKDAPGGSVLEAHARAMFGPDVGEKLAEARKGGPSPLAAGPGTPSAAASVHPLADTSPEGKVVPRGGSPTTPLDSAILHQTLGGHVQIGTRSTPFDTEPNIFANVRPGSPRDLRALEAHNGESGAPYHVNAAEAKAYGMKPEADAEYMHAYQARALGVEVPSDLHEDDHVILKSGAPPDAKFMMAGEARDKGWDVPKGLSEHDLVAVTPKKLSPAELHAEITSISDAAAKDKNIPGIHELERAALQVRDKYPAVGVGAGGPEEKIVDPATGKETVIKNFAAHQHRVGQDIAEQQQTFERAGLLQQGDPDKRFYNAATGYKAGGRPASVDRALEDVAGKAGAQPNLDLIAGQRAYGKIAENAKARNLLRIPQIAGHMFFGHSVEKPLTALGLRLDPILSRLGGNAGTLGGAGGAALGGKTTPQQYSQRPNLDMNVIDRLLNRNPQPPGL